MLRRASFLYKPFWWVIFFLVCLVASVALCTILFFTYRARIVSNAEVQHAPVVIVFGAGIYADGTPSDILKDRLDVAADLYTNGIVDRILVSGDNSTTDYDEPSNMMRYLVEQKDIPDAVIYRDFAGRRTYDTCARAKEIWGIENALLVTQGYHLPRALMLCSANGIDVYGVSASLQSYIGMGWYSVREALAFTQGIVDAYLFKPKYVTGNKEVDLDPAQ